MTDWNPTPKYKFYLAKIQDIIGTEPRTVRDIYYALEARGFPAECADAGFDFEYRYVKRAVKKGRRNGYIDPALIIDTSRQAVTDQQGSFPEPKAWLKRNERHIKRGYYRNFWEGQPTYVEVWLEKASLASVFEPICDDLNVRLEATRGDWSDSKVYEATERLRGPIHDGKHAKVLYFGDFNPSGLHAPAAVQNTMGHYGMPFPFRGDSETEARYFDIWPWDGKFSWSNTDGSIEFERIALNLSHIERFDLPENPTPSSTDKDATLKERFMRYASSGRDVNIELNALKEYHREFLEDLLRDSIEAHIDEEAREAFDAETEEMQESIRDAVGEFDYDSL